MSEQQIFEMAQIYYPHLWNKGRLKALVSVSRLTAEHYEEITGETFAE